MTRYDLTLCSLVIFPNVGCRWALVFLRGTPVQDVQVPCKPSFCVQCLAECALLRGNLCVGTDFACMGSGFPCMQIGFECIYQLRYCSVSKHLNLKMCYWIQEAHLTTVNGQAASMTACQRFPTFRESWHIQVSTWLLRLVMYYDKECNV